MVAYSRPMGSGGGARYDWRYLTGQHLGAEEYYLGRDRTGERVTAEAFGRGAEVLGLERIDAGTFANLHAGLAGRLPASDPDPERQAPLGHRRVAVRTEVGFGSDARCD